MIKIICTCLTISVLISAQAAMAANAIPVEIVDTHGKVPAADAAAQTTETYPTKSMTAETTLSPMVNEPADENTSVPANDKNYTIQAGDVLQITVWKEADMDREILVLPDGTISFPLIGSFTAEGLTPAQVQATIKQKLKTLIPDASITVVVKAALGHSVSIIGQVAKPGEIVMSHPLTVLQALSQAGGLTPFASESNIIVLRTISGKQTSIEFPYDDISEGKSLDKNITLQPGDVIMVPTAGLF